jgi:hypothetical protein
MTAENSPENVPRTCLAPARFWQAQAGAASWTAAELQHLVGCRRCRDHLALVERAVTRTEALQAATAVGLAAAVAVHRARRAVVRLGAGPAFAAYATADTPVRLDFAEDADLAATLYRDRHGVHWLHLEHALLPPGTLLQVVLETPGGAGPTWARYVVLRPGLDHAVAETCVEEALPAGSAEQQLRVRVIASAAALPPEDAPALYQSFVRARSDDPAAVAPDENTPTPAWRFWAERTLTDESVSGEIRFILQEILRTQARDEGPGRPV